MNKTKLAIFGVVAAAVAAVSMLAVQADTPALAVTCAGNVSNNVVTWTATSTGGNAPYAFLWSGDASVAGSTSTSMQVTYGTNGTYKAMIQATDASSTVATSTCSAVVSSNVVVAPTSTLNVFLGVDNSAGGSATSSNFVVTVGGATANPASFNGSAAGTAVQVNASTTYSVNASTFTNYVAGMSGTCVGPLTAGATASCTITETYVPPTVTPTSTPPLPRVNPPSLSIGPNGAFLARGMTVTSVSSGSFQGTVWGITYTVNWSGNFFPEFYFRGGKSASSTTNPVDQLAIGDEVGVIGTVTAANPLIVNGKVVRDYSITMPRPGKREGQPGSPFYNGQGNGGGGYGNSWNGNGGNGNNQGAGSSASATVNVQSHINDLMNQLHNLQGLFKGFGGKH